MPGESTKFLGIGIRCKFIRNRIPIGFAGNVFTVCAFSPFAKVPALTQGAVAEVISRMEGAIQIGLPRG